MAPRSRSAYGIRSISRIGHDHANVGEEAGRECALDVVCGLVNVAGQLLLVGRIEKVMPEAWSVSAYRRCQLR